MSAGTHVAEGHINTDMDREIGAGGVSKLWLLKAGHSDHYYRVIQVTVFFNFSLTNTKKQKKWQNPTIFVQDIWTF